jgi:hypothetical protein
LKRINTAPQLTPHGSLSSSDCSALPRSWTIASRLPPNRDGKRYERRRTGRDNRSIHAGRLHNVGRRRSGEVLPNVGDRRPHRPALRRAPLPYILDLFMSYRVCQK